MTNDPKGKQCIFKVISAYSNGITLPEEATRCPGEACAQCILDMGGRRCGLCR